MHTMHIIDRQKFLYIEIARGISQPLRSQTFHMHARTEKIQGKIGGRAFSVKLKVYNGHKNVTIAARVSDRKVGAFQ